MPILIHAFDGATTGQCNELSGDIIDNGLMPWQTSKKYKLRYPEGFDHVDIKMSSRWANTDKYASLKGHGVRFHAKTVQDFPVDPYSEVTEEEIVRLKKYLKNDLDLTELIYRELEGELEIKIALSRIYRQDFRSFTASKIAEEAMKSELGIVGKVKVPKLKKGEVLSYKSPAFIKFESSELNGLLTDLNSMTLGISQTGHMIAPKELKDRKVSVGDNPLVYTLGIGGFHTTEKSIATVCSEDQVMIRSDIVSMYPSTIKNLEIYPKHIGRRFLDRYVKLLEDRVKIKGRLKQLKEVGKHEEAEQAKLESDAKKLILNSIYGKFSSQYSTFYDPECALRIVVGNQLSMLMLIERLELSGFIKLVSGNTDGICCLMSKDKVEGYKEICQKWCKDTGFDLEHDEIRALYSSNVNSYLEVTDTGCLGKGKFNSSAVDKVPDMRISYKAVEEYLENKVPIEQTIKKCKSVEDFIVGRRINVGVLWWKDGISKEIGKDVRWTYCTDETRMTWAKAHAKAKNEKKDNPEKWPKVPESEGSYPMLTLEGMPDNIDYEKYIRKSYDILDDVGVEVEGHLFSKKESKERKSEQNKVLRETSKKARGSKARKSLKEMLNEIEQ